MPRVRRAALVTALLTMLAAVVLVLDGHPAAATRHPKTFYLALGDSISYGFQTAKARAGLPPTAFDSGYVDVVSAHLDRRRQQLRTVNLGCPGESTTSITQPCGWRSSGHALHDDYAGSQLRAALSFLGSHRHQVGLITIALGGNDINAFLAQCPSGDVACLVDRAPAETAALASRMDEILGHLRRAAPRAQLVVVGFYDPNLGAFEIADPLFAAVNDALRAVTIANGGRFADVMARFNPALDEAPTICRLTLICVDGDAHPSDAGYRVIGEEVIAQLRSGRPRI